MQGPQSLQKLAFYALRILITAHNNVKNGHTIMLNQRFHHYLWQINGITEREHTVLHHFKRNENPVK